ncbi:MAG: DUF4062 domain-containing protein [Myxococcales bacterium]|nr:DUF4062 domain-containing protein [Myxococcales bacterium]
MTAIDVFLSSTCYDLVDIRAELKDYLTMHSFLVRMSESYDSSFEVNARVDSIESCLDNVGKSNVVVCILDRRYGPKLPENHRFSGISATHAEIKHAWACKKPVLTFIRDVTMDEVGSLNRNADFDTRWIGKQGKAELASLVNEVTSLRAAVDQKSARSNWYDTFENVVDLKPRLLKRLLDCFPDHVGTYARRGDRMVRLYWEVEYGWKEGIIQVRVSNAGFGPAIEVSICSSSDGKETVVRRQGGLASGGQIAAVKVSIPSNRNGASLLVYYSNLWGDKYRVRLALIAANGTRGYNVSSSEVFEICINEQWMPV